MSYSRGCCLGAMPKSNSVGCVVFSAHRRVSVSWTTVIQRFIQITSWCFCFLTLFLVSILKSMMVGRHVCAVYWCHTVGIFFIPTFTTSLLPSYDIPSYQRWFAQTLHSFFVRWFDWLRSENLYALDTPFAWPTPNCPMCANIFYWRSDSRQKPSGSPSERQN